MERSAGDATGTATSAAVDVSIVIPTRNEEAGIARCIREAERALDELGLTGEIIVSDSSDDLTPEIARERGARVLTPDRPGYGYAYRYAFSETRGDLVVIGDGDTTYDFSELPRLVERIEAGADIVLGSRFDGEIRDGSMPTLHRYVGNPVLTRFLNAFYGTDISDAHSGFRVITGDALDQLDLRSDGMEFASEMLMQASQRGLRIEEVPITYRQREGEATLDSFADGWRHVKFMLVNAPSDLYTVPGLLFVALGVGLMGLSFFDVRPFGQDFGVNSMIAGSLLTLVGSQTVALAVFTSFLADSVKKPWGRVNPWITRNFSPERGVAAGLLLFVVGSAYAVYLVGTWYASGFAAVPTTQQGLAGATLILLGVQTVLQSFFISIVSENGGGE